jgi:hypothetical protein
MFKIYRLPIKECNNFLKECSNLGVVWYSNKTRNFIKRYEPLIYGMHDTAFYFKTESDMLLFKLKYNV